MSLIQFQTNIKYMAQVNSQKSQRIGSILGSIQHINFTICE